MKLLKTLGSALCLAFLFITLSSKAQTTATTDNLVTNNNWTGIGAYAPDPLNCCSNPAGSQPLYDTTTGIIKFSYGQATVQQAIAVNQALAMAGTGIQVNGYSWGYDLRNMNGHGGQGGTDTISVLSYLRNTAGQNVLAASQTYNTQFDWTSFSGTQTLTTPATVSSLSTVGIAFTSRDSGYWAGLYGPEVRNVSLRLNYGVDPCATNPAYSPSCAGFNTVVLSGNLVPNPYGYAVSGDSINQSYAINTALASAGSGATVHGFQWGYIANANGPYCAFWFLGCWDERIPSVTTNVNITNSSGASIYNVTREYTNSYNNTNYSYLFPSSQPITSLGNFNFTGYTNDQAYLGGMYSRALYTVDPCVSNVLSSPTCKGYYDALAKLTPQVTTTTTQTTTSTGTTTTVDNVVISPTSTYVASSQPTETQTTTQQTTSVSSSTPVTSSVQQTTVAQSAPSATQTKVGEPSDSGGSSKSTVSLSSVLSMISSNQDKTSALEKSVVQAADAQAFSAGESAKQQAEKIAGDAQSQSIAISNSQSASVVQASSQISSMIMQNSGISLQGNLQSNTVAASTRSEQSGSFGNNQASSSGFSSSQQSDQNSGKQDSFGATQGGLPASRYEPPKVDMSNSQSFTQGQYQPTNVRQEVVVASVSPTVSYSLVPTMKMPTQVQVELPTTEGIKFGHKGVLDNAMEEKPFVSQTTQEQKQNDSVKKNVQNNDAAGNVTIESIAKQPANYAQYFTMIPDVAFYAPKEIYKNQKTIDNARALRQMSSDKLHQEMINQQYKIGN